MQQVEICNFKNWSGIWESKTADLNFTLASIAHLQLERQIKQLFHVFFCVFVSCLFHPFLCLYIFLFVFCSLFHAYMQFKSIFGFYKSCIECIYALYFNLIHCKFMILLSWLTGTLCQISQLMSQSTYLPFNWSPQSQHEPPTKSGMGQHSQVLQCFKLVSCTPPDDFNPACLTDCFK